ncbi:transglycosylase SLT domain-containing protein [Undibacterium sp. TS12]|uniref:transglycosylase SLT domain-containing protein n=1 Tax=Undibacterium sp. TS12 TaxID=2908202 RepID=UPI001F4D248A|nr:transglycosylase SLT domain-containing protein [Undibacterium sp. TS12]MCH8622618.1 transglycosylase SLT domain-containing protein [Undibacterium sp. TS12]
MAIAHKESGFNPDAAAGTSSATVLGQFTNATRKQNGLGGNEMWDVDERANKLVRLTADYIRLAKKNLRGLDYVYKYHDGPNRKERNGSESEALNISRNEVMPRAKMFLKILRGE